MAKKRNEQEEVAKNWREGELIMSFGLNPIQKHKTPLMEEWLNAPLPELNALEQVLFDRILKRAIKNIEYWEKEDLKMRFISYILDLGLVNDANGIVMCFDNTVSAVVQDIRLTVKSDFMVASGVMNVIKKPFFHFQEYKPLLNPTGEPMAQLLEAFLIAQVKNENDMPLYGVEVVGENWKFVIMEGKNYCISPAYNSILAEDLMKIIGILRKFQEILETRLINY